MSLTRRDILTAAPGLAAGMVLGSTVACQKRESTERPFRLAHLTDIHFRPGKLQEETLSSVLRRLPELGVDLAVNGGDVIFDASHTERAEVERQWAGVKRILQAESATPLIHVLGNHDIYALAGDKRDPAYKAEALQHLGLERAYYSLERGGWKIIVLDSIGWSPNTPRGYEGKLDAEQFEWLRSELEGASLPVCLISHIPILSACAFFDGPNEQKGAWSLPVAWMHVDARALKELLVKYKVKLCLSGHIHLADRVEYAGVTFCCNGAVCGNYWEGAYQEFPPAFGLVELFPDGRFTNRLVNTSLRGS